MKLITAIIKPQALPAVKRELFESRVLKMTITNALGAGEEHGYVEIYRGVRHEVNLLKRIRLEIAVNEDFVERTIEAIIRGAQTGKSGDGKIFVTALSECVKISGGERGTRAI